ncbi:MAG: hypothetical protein FJX16_11605, partial [Alphaproteobacteria bacterium]|nr:hypothetical protein [Alphaproteobacteria bacterium]
LRKRTATSRNQAVYDHSISANCNCVSFFLSVESLERFPITWNHVIDKESLKIKTLEQVLIEKVCQLFRNLL